MVLYKSYKDMTDKEIVDLIIAGNEEAMLYLLYDRYENDLKFYVWRYYDSLAYLEDLTNYFSYTTGYTYLYQAEADANDPYIATAPRTRAIADNENKLSFEYKCAKGGSIEFFFKIIAGCSVAGLNFPAADDWTSITFDLTDGKANALRTDPACLDAGVQMRFDINNINGIPMYIRNIRIHK